ncbi:MAG: hypothetical protein GY835_08840 [bacterium]|nr:hypothetical protein [bacterium]
MRNRNRIFVTVPLATKRPSTSSATRAATRRFSPTPGVRRTSWIYDTRGRPTAQTIEGLENGAPFSYTTETIYNGPGMVLGLNPPGNGYRDMTVFEYDTERGELILSSRIDPLVGTTWFGHDGFNRRLGYRSPGGVADPAAPNASRCVLR